MQQTVQQRPGGITCTRVNNETGGLVDNEERLVFMGNREFDRLRAVVDGRLGLCMKFDRFTTVHAVLGLARLAIDHDSAVEQPGL